MARLGSCRGDKITKTMCRLAGQKYLVRFPFLTEVAGEHSMAVISLKKLFVLLILS